MLQSVTHWAFKISQVSWDGVIYPHTGCFFYLIVNCMHAVRFGFLSQTQTVLRHLPVMGFICCLPPPPPGWQRQLHRRQQQTPPKKQLTALTNGKLCRAALINRNVCSGLWQCKKGAGSQITLSPRGSSLDLTGSWTVAHRRRWQS